MTKTCTHCKETKPANRDYFVKSKNTSSGITSPCRECHKRRMVAVNKVQYQKNREREMVESYAKADAKAGRRTTITAEWFKQNIVTRPCFYCETVDAPRGTDRLDNSLGHTPENVVPCCKLCNKTRNNHFSPDEMKRLGVIIKQIRLERLATA